MTTLNKPLIYVHGNHDAELEARVEGRFVERAKGCYPIDGRDRAHIGFQTFLGVMSLSEGPTAAEDEAGDRHCGPPQA